MQGDKTSQTVNTGSQAAKHDEGKAQLSLVPTKITYAIARIREYGTKKYGDPENWRQVELQRYRDAMYRHMLAYIDDPHGVDEESGLPHLWHLACNVAFLCELDDAEELTPLDKAKQIVESTADTDEIQEIADYLNAFLMVVRKVQG